MTLISSQRLYSGRVLNLDLDTVRFPDGSDGTLEMIRHPGASAVLPFFGDPRAPDPQLLLLRQFRHAADTVLWEIPAGRMDPGESPEACAHRELEEETGMRAGRLEAVGSILTTPGFTDERIHLFLAAELVAAEHRRERDEFIELRRIRWTELGGMIADGEIEDGKTLAAYLFVQCWRQKA